MGNCFSDPSAHEKKLKSNVIGGSQKLGSGPPRTSNAPVHSPPKPRYNEPPRVLGGGTAGLVTSGDGAVGSPGEEDPRDRMRLAAEERAKSASSKGVSASNPKSGQLSAKLAAERRANMHSPQQQDTRLMDKGEWN